MKTINWKRQMPGLKTGLTVSVILILTGCTAVPDMFGQSKETAPQEQKKSGPKTTTTTKPPSSGPSQSPEKKLSDLRIVGKKKVVTIYEFRSSVPEIAARAATDMFTTAIVNSQAFAVVERQRLDQGINKEKRLKSSKKASNKGKTTKLTGADFIFEGTISEAAANKQNDEYGVSMKGMDVNKSARSGSIGLDLRILEADTGKIVDAVHVRKKIKSSGTGISGVGNMIRSIGIGSSSTPDVKMKSSKNDALDEALRSCIDEAVYDLVKKFMTE